MAETETGWTKDFPQVDGAYWLRFADPDSEACIVEVVRSVVFQTGVVGDIRNRVLIDECEWLGPLAASDFEQLTRLRAACEAALIALDMATFSDLDATGDRAKRLLREALRKVK